MSKLKDLAKLGQSVWLDYISRAILEDGSLKKFIEDGVRGITSNPTIFERAITGSNDYDADLKKLVAEDESVDEIYESLVLDDIGRAADMFRPVYDDTDGLDGYVSIEVSPALAHDTEGTVSEARRLFKELDRPNIMIKIPATVSGLPAITQLIGEGMNVNVTLMFSMNHYLKVADAYLTGLEQLLQAGGDLKKTSSVASFFVSRVDVVIDNSLSDIGNSELQGKIAIANSKFVYQQLLKTFDGPRWDILKSAGARVQRVLWASTGTKNPAYPKTLYVDELIGDHTVNTLPPATLDDFLHDGTVAMTITSGLEKAKADLEQIESMDIDLDAVTEALQQEGVKKFNSSFDTLKAAIQNKRACLLTSRYVKDITYHGLYEEQNSVIESMKQQEILPRIWKKDHTVWQSDPAEISNRLGWLHSPKMMTKQLNEINSFVEDIINEGFTHVLLLGMGGSSLAPEVFSKIFGVHSGYLELSVLDSTHPDAVLEYSRTLNFEKTLFITSTKSGGTVETLSFLKYFYNLAVGEMGIGSAGRHFIAITDAGSGLEKLALDLKFRKIFLNDPEIGGRYSVLSHFGLLPAALIGVDVAKLLERAQAMFCDSGGCSCDAHTPESAVALGAFIAEWANRGRDKLTFISSEKISPFGPWVEQLIAESTGKEGKGILPVVGEDVLALEHYSDDRVFIYTKLSDDKLNDATVIAFRESGFPVAEIMLNDIYDLGGEFFRWELATAIAGHLLHINPFDQPNVESAKKVAREMVAAYKENGKLPETAPALSMDDMDVYSDDMTADSDGSLLSFLDKYAKNGNEQKGRSYVAIQAFVPPTDMTEQALHKLRVRIHKKYRIATTVGYGPRFLHSTGQLHKGDAGNGLFIQITGDAHDDIDIPDNAGEMYASMTFGVLVSAQAMGDRQALQLADPKRKTIRYHIKNKIVESINELAAMIQ